MGRVLLAICAELPDGDEDGELLIQALAGHGVDARWAAWTDRAVDWGAGLVVLRSTWDYPADRNAFIGWVSGLRRVANPPPVVRWNTDKMYLRDLAAAGVRTVPTTFAAPGEPAQFADVTGELIVKPSVGAGSRGVGRFTPNRLELTEPSLFLQHDSGAEPAVTFAAAIAARG